MKFKNFKIDRRARLVTISVNPSIFPLEVVYSAAYVFMNDAYVILDGDPKSKILVHLKAKNSRKDLEALALEFNNELLNYAVYAVQAAKTQEIRKAIVERALMTNTLLEESLEYEEPKKEEKVEFIEDPLGIAKPWTPEMAAGLKPPKIDEKVERKKETEEQEIKEPDEITNPWGFNKCKC